MNQGVWMGIIQFLEPVDLLASLLATSKSIQSIVEKCIVTFDHITQCCCNGSGARISFSIDNSTTDGPNHLNILHNARYFINLYVLKLAIKLGDVKLEEESRDRVGLILDENECNLIEFYRTSFLLETKHNSVHHDENTNSSESSQTIPRKLLYQMAGFHSGIGKTSFHTSWRKGFYSHYYGVASSYYKNIGTLPNGISIEHILFNTLKGEQRFFTKPELLDRLSKHNGTPLFLFFFSMDHWNTFEDLDEWMNPEIFDDTYSLDIIVGLHPHGSYIHKDELKPVPVKDAVEKAWKLGRSVFVEVDAKIMKNVYAPSWFLQLKHVYFKDLSITNKVPELKDPTYEWVCSIL